MEKRRSSGGVRVIGLTPPGISSNEVLKYVIDDIVEGTVRGFPFKSYNGSEVVVFLDPVFFIGDYPAVSHTLDLLGHTANIPCHLCCIERYDKSGRGGTKYGYTVDINSCHPSYSRSLERSLAIRSANLSVLELKQLGMKPDKEHDSKFSGLIELGKRLSACKSSIPRTPEGKPVVSSVFDAYRSCVVSPDHLFLGLAQDVINAVLVCLPKEVRETGEMLAKDLLRDEGLVFQNKLINSGRRAVLSMTISGMYSFLLVAPMSFRNAWIVHCGINGVERNSLMREEEALVLLSDLQRLICKTQFSPRVSFDGEQDFLWYNDGEGRTRLRELLADAKDYIRKVDAYCGKHEIPKSPLDKPNLHRLLEFYTHSLPILGDIGHFQELLFEGAHQPLKRGIAKSNQKDAQLQSMEHRLSEDWKQRLCVEINNDCTDRLEWGEHIVSGVSGLLGHNPNEYSDFKSLRDRIANAFPPPVLSEIYDLRGRNMCYTNKTLR